MNMRLAYTVKHIQKGPTLFDDAALPHAEAARGGRCVGTDPYIAPEVASAGQ